MSNPDSFSEQELIEIVENQLADNHPIKVKETLLRLTMTGMDREEAVQYIACALALEIQAVVEEGGAFDEARYGRHLAMLPEMPWAEE
ncbi:hypothetical protein PVT67_07625 [Gallaecimonas kandeliae]|uniref:hypothetical protein n=1 Tax=Gallaecimonas kandeliae TaxID=3029055 RepID=UPI0026478B1B|nr:hypothetical protein [Gallaecimonas kandeliae]WKE67096.1 hypothetical protein PVT67_07625 [Gallaecimonas kandeliae]